jgi:hypothetical protein
MFKENPMRQSITTRVLLATAFVTALAALAPTAAMASEGARSVGKGMKCSTRAVQQADGTVTYQYVCYKAI